MVHLLPTRCQYIIAVNRCHCFSEGSLSRSAGFVKTQCVEIRDDLGHMCNPAGFTYTKASTFKTVAPVRGLKFRSLQG